MTPSAEVRYSENEKLSLSNSPKGHFHPRLNEITHLAMELCQMPMAFVGLNEDLAARLQWRGIYGFSENSNMAPLAYFFAKIEQQSSPIEIKNMQTHPGYPAIEDLNISYSYVLPLLSKNGDCLGTLAVMDYKDKILTLNQKASLEILVQQVVCILENDEKNRILEKQIFELQESNQTILNQRDRLMHAQKMAALGEMAAGISHEINNPLAIICATLDVMTTKGFFSEDSSPPLGKYRKVIQGNVERIQKIIHGLKIYAKEGKITDLRNVDVQEVIGLTLSTCEQRLRDLGIELKLEVTQPAKIRCNPTQISQVLLNLVSNSIEALEERKVKSICLTAVLSGKHLKISIEDSGLPLDETVRKRLFEPFFSTKVHGTGLGLSVSRGIMRLHRGDLYLDDQAECTRFVAMVPISSSLPLPN